MTSVFIIAEAGVNHNGSLERALAMVDVAAEAGADAVKFQTFKAENVASASAARAEYQGKNMPGITETQLEMLKRLELPFEDFRRLKARADERGIAFMSKPSSPDAADAIEELVTVWKVSSGEVTNHPFIKYIAEKNKPIILSTGTATLDEVAEAVVLIEKHQRCTSKTFPPLTLLQCTTSYPCPFEDVNLKVIETLKGTFNLPVGFSDHTLGIEAAIAAAAMGAEIIEKHFTLDKSLPGPDHRASLSPDELAQMVAGIRNVEKALGDGIKRLMPSEEKNAALVRKSLVAHKAITRGEELTEDNVAIKRPTGGIEPKDFEKILGKKAARDIARDELITWDDLKR